MSQLHPGTHVTSRPVRIAGVLLAMLALVCATAASAEEGRDVRGSLEHGGIKRSYIVHLPAVPAARAKGLALLVALHGGGGRATGFAAFTGFTKLADQAGIVVVYPQGVGRQWNDGRTRIGFRAHAENIDDVGFLKKLIEAVGKRFGTDRKRVFVAGASNGGMMAMRLACESADKVSGVAAVIANFPVRLRFRCAPARPVPILIMNGTNDPIMPWRGGEIRFGFKRQGKVLSTEATVAYWVQKNGCAAAPTSERLPDKVNDGTEIRRDTYADCSDGAKVVLYTVDRGGHTWPGGRQYLPIPVIGKVNRDLAAQDAIWSFFKAIGRR